MDCMISMNYMSFMDGEVPLANPKPNSFATSAVLSQQQLITLCWTRGTPSQSFERDASLLFNSVLYARDRSHPYASGFGGRRARGGPGLWRTDWVTESGLCQQGQDNVFPYNDYIDWLCSCVPHSLLLLINGRSP